MLLVVRVDSYAVPLNLSLHGSGPVCDTPTKGQLLLFIMHVDVAQPPLCHLLLSLQCALSLFNCAKIIALFCT